MRLVEPDVVARDLEDVWPPHAFGVRQDSLHVLEDLLDLEGEGGGDGAVRAEGGLRWDVSGRWGLGDGVEGRGVLWPAVS